MTEETNGWTEMKRLVMHELVAQRQAIREISDRLRSIEQQIVRLEMKSSAWGAVSGALIVLGYLIASTFSVK